MKCNSYDIDGVIYLGLDLEGLTPTPKDIIITGRSIEEKPETEFMLEKRGIKNVVFYNPLPFNEKTRESSGWHKAKTLHMVKDAMGIEIQIHWEDDDIQADIIEKECPWVKVVRVFTPFVEKENVRHTINV